MKCATASLVLLCFLINSCVHVQSSVDDFKTWIDPKSTSDTGTLKTTCKSPPDTLENACKEGAKCTGAGVKLTDCNAMCTSFSAAYSCGADLTTQMTALTACIDKSGSGNNPCAAEDYNCVTTNCIPAPDGNSVQNFANWAAPSPPGKDGIKDACDDSTPKDACVKAQSDGRPGQNANPATADNWKVMCEALDGFYCEAEDINGKVTDITTCCTNSKDGCLNTGTYAQPADQETCCATCIDNHKPKPPAPSPPATTTKPGPTAPGPTNGPSPGPASTTAKPPAPGPGPTSDTTTMESTSTEEGGSDDSAFPLGPSGLLVALIAMIATVINIA